MRLPALTDDLLTLADARRQVAIVLRRRGHPDTARRVLLAAADAVEPTGHAGAEQWSAWAPCWRPLPTPRPSTVTASPHAP